MVFRRCHIHIYDNWGTSYLVSRLVPANIVAPRIIAWNDNYLRWKREGLADSHPMISHIHIVLLTIRIIFVVPRNRSSGQILLHIWIVSGICIIYDDGSPVRVVFHWHYIHKNYRWEASSEDSRRGTRTFIFSPCNIIRKEDHLWWEREGLPDRAPEIIKVASIPLRVYITCIPFDFIVIKWQIDICVARFNLSSCSIASNYCFSIYKWRPYKCSG